MTRKASSGDNNRNVYTVAELIEILKQAPQDQLVLISRGGALGFWNGKVTNYKDYPIRFWYKDGSYDEHFEDCLVLDPYDDHEHDKTYRDDESKPVPICKQCGHEICPHCWDWCHEVAENGDFCCKANCLLEEPEPLP
jgi:hypothetical protein